MRSILVLFIISAGFFSKAQSYTVIHSIGKIFNVSSGQYLSKGMKIDESSELRFDSNDARAAVLSTTKGRYIVQQNSGGTSQSDIAYTLSSIINPARGQLSTRSGGILNSIDFENYFGNGPVAVLGGTYRLPIYSTSYQINQDKFFYVQYVYQDEVINKKLSNEGSTLIFDLASIYSIDGEAIDPVDTMMLYYYNEFVQESNLLATVQMNEVSMDDLRELSSNYENPKSEENIKSICEWINDLYGRCTEAEVAQALERL